MASTYSTNLALELIGTGDQAGTWGTTTNTNLGTLIEQAVSGYVTQAITDGADTVITIPNGATGVARNMFIECTGALTAARNLIVPANKKLYFIYNNTTGGYAVTVKVSGQTGVSVPNGSKFLLVSNGTDIVNATSFLYTGGPLGTPSSGTVTNLTGTASININGTVGATTPASGAFTTLSASSDFAIATNKFTVAAASGNTSVAGTLASGSLAVTGGITATTSSGYGLSITTAANAFSGMNIARTVNTAASWDVYIPAGSTDLRFFNNADRMTLDSSGNLVVGNTSPGTYGRLTVTGGTISIVTDTSTYRRLSFWSTSNGNSENAYIQVQNDGGTTNTGEMLFATKNSGGTLAERARLDASGNLGLGVTPSAWSNTKAFQVGGFGALSCDTASDGNVSLSWNAYATGASSWVYKTTGAALKYTQDGAHKWYTAASGTAGNAISFTQAMTLDSSGLAVTGTQTTTTSTNGYATSQFVNSSTGSSAVSRVSIGNNASADAGQIVVYGSNHSTLPNVMDVNNANSAALRFLTGNAVRGWLNTSSWFSLGSAAAPAFPLDFRLGANSGDWFAHFENGTAAAYGMEIYYSGGAPNGSANYFFLCRDTGASRMYVRSDGGIANYQANDQNLSDRREKKEFEPARSYLDVICAIPVQTFRYIDQTDEERNLGVVAQDVQEVAPELVHESNWGTKDDPKMRLSIYQTDMQYALMKCIQEQQEIINELKARVTALEAA